MTASSEVDGPDVNYFGSLSLHLLGYASRLVIGPRITIWLPAQGHERRVHLRGQLSWLQQSLHGI